MKHIRMIFLSAIYIALLSACANIKDTWDETQKINTVASYKAYIMKHRSSEYTPIAKSRISKLTKQKDDADWKIIKDRDTVAYYKKYLKNYSGPKKYRKKAKRRIIVLREKELYQEIIVSKGKRSVTTYYLKYPKGKYTSSIYKLLSKDNGYYQAGAYRLKFKPRIVKVIKSIKRQINEGFIRITNGAPQVRYITTTARKGYTFVKIRSDIYNDTGNDIVRKSDIYLTDGSKIFPIINSTEYQLDYFIQVLSLAKRSNEIRIPTRVEMEFLFEVNNNKLDKLYLAYKGKRTVLIKKAMKSLKQK